MEIGVDTGEEKEGDDRNDAVVALLRGAGYFLAYFPAQLIKAGKTLLAARY